MSNVSSVCLFLYSIRSCKFFTEIIILSFHNMKRGFHISGIMQFFDPYSTVLLTMTRLFLFFWSLLSSCFRNIVNTFLRLYLSFFDLSCIYSSVIERDTHACVVSKGRYFFFVPRVYSIKFNSSTNTVFSTLFSDSLQLLYSSYSFRIIFS